MKSSVQALLFLLLISGQQITMVLGVVEGDQANEEKENAPLTDDQLQQMEEDQESHEFQAEVGRLMDIIINSLYQNKEVFLRELISNASDALDKIRFRAINDPDSLGETRDLEIRLSYDEEAKTITLTDTGIGMSKQGLVNNLGTIAKSGTTQFIEAVASGDNLNLIGQFGVGFYSAFLAANTVTVTSKSDDDDQYIWESSAANSFSITKDPRGDTLGRGTEIVIHLKSDAYDFCNQDTLRALAKKYSEFINFPIYLKVQKEITKEVPVDDEELEDDDESEEEREDEDDDDDDEDDEDDDIDVEDEDEDEEDEPQTKTIRETVWEWERVNDVKAIWYRSKEDIEEEEYSNFYKSLSKDYADPLTHIHFIAEGEVQFRSILYIPEHAPYDQFENYYGKSSSLKLYVRRVLINDEFEDLMPRYLNFIKGIVDSDDLPLNVSREQLQQLKMIRVMSRKLVRKTIEMIRKLSEVPEDEDDDEDYNDEEYEDDEYEEEDDEDYEDDDEDYEDDDEDDYDDDYVEKTEEELREEKEERQRKRTEKIENYEKFWTEFGKNIKLGIIEDPGNRGKLSKLTRWYSTKNTTKLISFDQYIDQEKESQEEIYYMAGESIQSILESPNIQGLVKKGYEVLLLDEPVDEFCFQHLQEYEKQKLVNVAKSDFKFPEDDVERRKLKKLKKMYQPLTNFLQDQLKDEVDKVIVSQKLVTDPVMVVAKEGSATASQEKYQRAQVYSRKQQITKSKKVFEINPHHPILKEMLERVKDNPDDSSTIEMSKLLYETALLSSGYQIDNVNDYSQMFYRVFNGALGISRDAVVEEIEIDLDDEDDEFDENDLDDDDEFDEFDLDDEEENLEDELEDEEEIELDDEHHHDL